MLGGLPFLTGIFCGNGLNICRRCSEGHLKSLLHAPSLFVPVMDSYLVCGTYQTLSPSPFLSHPYSISGPQSSRGWENESCHLEQLMCCWFFSCDVGMGWLLSLHQHLAEPASGMNATSRLAPPLAMITVVDRSFSTSVSVTTARICS